MAYNRVAFKRCEIAGLQCIIASDERVDEAKHIVILCHGFGASGDDLAPFAYPLSELTSALSLPTLFVFPEAPIDLAEFGIPGGFAWWPLNMAKLMQLAATDDFGDMREEVPLQLDDARRSIEALIAELQNRFVPKCRAITLGGFSQGAMLATDVAFRGKAEPPQILLAMSGALICESAWQANRSRLAMTEVIQSHGRQDTILPIQTGRWLRDLLSTATTHHKYIEFSGGHTIPFDELEGPIEESWRKLALKANP